MGRITTYAFVMCVLAVMLVFLGNWTHNDLKREAAEKQENKQFCAEVYTTEYDKIPLSDINYCKWWYETDGYYVEEPPCTKTLHELSHKESWPVACHGVAEEIGIDPPKDKGAKVNIEKNNKVVVE